MGGYRLFLQGVEEGVLLERKEEYQQLRDIIPDRGYYQAYNIMGEIQYCSIVRGKRFWFR